MCRTNQLGRDMLVLLPIDLPTLKQSDFGKMLESSAACFNVQDVEALLPIDEVYFVISKYSMCSTAYQEMALKVMACTKQSRHWLLKLNDVQIPNGLRQLQSLTEK